MAQSKFTKQEIVDAVYEKSGINRKDVKDVVDLVFEAIKDALVEGMAIELRGFGTFEVRVRKGRKNARNPKTGKEVLVTSHGIAAFRGGRELKQALWNLPVREDGGL
jgi:integration host factor subunit beta